MDETKLGILVLLASLFCLGTWPALLRLCSIVVVPSINNTTKIRNLCHVYMDYGTAYFAVSCLPLLLALWLQPSLADDSNDGENAAASLSLPLILTACIGGSLLSCGNLSMQWATAVHHAPLTTVLSLQASMTVVLGTALNYLLESGAMTPHPHCLWAGVVVFLLAIGLAARAQVLYAGAQQTMTTAPPKQDASALFLKRHMSLEGVELEPYYVDRRSPGNRTVDNYATTDTTSNSVMINEATMMSLSNGEQKHEYDTMVSNNSCENGTILEVDDTGINNNHSHQGRSAIVHKSSTTRGVIIAALGGLCFGFFSPCFNIAVNDPFHWASSSATTSATAEDDIDIAFTVTIGLVNMWFSFAFWLASMVGNTLLLQQQSMHMMERPSVGTVLKDYLLQDALLERRLAVAAGLVCALGNVLQFQGGQMCGYATADLVQAFPLVSTVWDMVLFGEFRNVKLYSMLAALLLSMYAAYLSGIVLVASSSIP